MAKASAKELDKLADTYDHLAKMAGDAAKKAGVQFAGANAEEAGQGSDGTKYLITYLDDAAKEPIVWIDNDDYRTQKLGEPEKLEQYIDRIISSSPKLAYRIISSGRRAGIIKKDAHHIAHSKSAEHDRVFTNDKNRARAYAATDLDEVIAIGEAPRLEKTDHPERKDAKHGMLRSRTRFAFPVYNNRKLEAVRAYTAELLFRNAKNKNTYLYDIVRIKEDPSAETVLLNRVRRREAQSAYPLPMNPQKQSTTNQQEVKQKFSLVNVEDHRTGMGAEIAGNDALGRIVENIAEELNAGGVIDAKTAGAAARTIRSRYASTVSERTLTSNLLTAVNGLAKAQNEAERNSDSPNNAAGAVAPAVVVLY